MTTPKHLNHWGWGDASRFLDRDARKNLGGMVEGLLGFSPDAVLDPCPLSEATLPEPRLAPPKALGHLFEQTPFARAIHTYGRAFPDIKRGFDGDFGVAPDLVAHPRSADDVVALLDWCEDAGVAAIPYGGGTSVVGGVEAKFDGAYQAALSLDMRAMSALLDLDTTSNLARIQAGATGPVLEAALAAHGMTLRHYPQSFEYSTLGGWIATRAGGHFATVYTHIDDFVAGLSAVTPSGTYTSTPRPASGAGPAPDGFLIGSEGTLGVITEATMRVRPRPTFTSRRTVLFERGDFKKAVDAVRTLSQSGLNPANCRLLDGREAALHQVTFDGSSVLLLAFESAHVPVDALLEQALGIARACGGAVQEPKADSGDAGSSWRSAFLDAPYLLNNLVSLGLVVDTFETACTWAAFEAMHADIVSSVRATIKEVTGVKGRVSCRFTHVYPDGPAPYYTFVAKGRAGAEVEQWAAIKAAASDALARHGGTITHHHAVGRTHKPWYQREVDPLFLKMLRAAKTSVDPRGVMNPGALFDVNP